MPPSTEEPRSRIPPSVNGIHSISARTRHVATSGSRRIHTAEWADPSSEAVQRMCPEPASGSDGKPSRTPRKGSMTPWNVAGPAPDGFRWEASS